MEKPILRVCSFSGGKDSTAMLLRLLEEGVPVDVILFCDTGLEFPALYDHIRKVERDIGREITTVKCPDDFEYLFAHKPINRKPRSRNAMKYGTDRDGYSWAGLKLRWCTEVLKNRPREQYLQQLREKYEVLEYIGITADETHRINRKCNQKDGARLPLVEWGMTEADCLAYCKGRGYDWGGLYEKFHRVSCWCCPLQSLTELRVLYRDFPDLWAQLKRWDAMTWRSFKSDYTVLQLEQRFDFEDEWLKAGNRLGTRAFYSALRERLVELDGTEKHTDPRQPV